MKIFSVITLFGILLIFLAFAWYFSPMAEVRELRTENNALRDALSAAQNGNETELIAIVVTGFIGVMITCFAFFFLLLCFLAGKTPANFFRLPASAYPAEIHWQELEQLPDNSHGTDKISYLEHQHISIWEDR